MKKISYSFVVYLLLFSFPNLFAQDAFRYAEKGVTFKQDEIDPIVAERRAQLEEWTSEYVTKHPPSTHANGASLKLIPVVFHVLHLNGSENISRAQVLDALRIMNEDFRRLNPDTNDTPVPFRAVAADCNIEFRLAQKDPNGNCTDGVDRIYTTLTNNASNLSFINQWPPEKYLNIWVVKSISSGAIGYTFFPGVNPQLDGIIVLYNYVGTIGQASANTTQYRTLTYLAGNYLNLRNIWGNDGGSCIGSDFVGDTPNQANNTFNCPSFPLYDACTTSGDGIMFMNFMDWTNSNCQNLFTAGQSARIAATLADTIGHRDSLVSLYNLIETGTDGTPATLCPPRAAFSVANHHICAGDSVRFSDRSFNADTLTYSWSFPGGYPSTSSLANPYVTYLNPGTYVASLTTSNSAGSDSTTDSTAVIASGAASLTGNFSDDFETPGTFPGNGGYIENPDLNVNAVWSRVSGITGASGTSCLKMHNYFTNRVGEIDSWVTPSFDLSGFTGIQLRFNVSYAQNNTFNTDYLKVYYSLNCGKTWTNRYTKSGASLATISTMVTDFSPTSINQWRQEAITALAVLSNKPNVRFKIEFTAGPDNNLYIDDLNVTGTPVGINEVNQSNPDIIIFPTPFSASATINFSHDLTDASFVAYNVFGQKVKEMKHINGNSILIKRENLSSGIYIFDVTEKDGRVANGKLVVE